ncbi:SIS domain-containing protein [Methylococcus sp. Mc7]|uniref:SIS domain-containing protein n=1 Tax=Methylococcus sp. Mc7 TaxID=2860258 RepID=UPI0021076683|nr:SIS domain-containing protein [Methylococcus sp. Mc7]
MRLMHGGYDVFVVGEIVTPSIRKGDLLIVISGSGETETMLAFTKKAKEQGANIALISTRDSSSLGDLADNLFRIGSPSSSEKSSACPWAPSSSSLPSSSSKPPSLTSSTRKASPKKK